MVDCVKYELYFRPESGGTYPPLQGPQPSLGVFFTTVGLEANIPVWQQSLVLSTTSSGLM